MQMWRRWCLAQDVIRAMRTPRHGYQAALQTMRVPRVTESRLVAKIR